MAEKFNIIDLVSNNGCFDLQFRKDTRHERTNAPTYYRWKIQFIITASKYNGSILKKVKRVIGCGNIGYGKGQARFSVQDIDEIVKRVVPFFNKNRLKENKKKDFHLWQKAVEIIYRNKGISIAKWEKNDLLSLIEIHKSIVKYKKKPRQSKWIQVATLMTKKP